MKKRIFSILLSLCMALLIFPVTAHAEDLVPITKIDVDVKSPIIGEHLEYSWNYMSTPNDVIDVDLEWYQISKENYTRTEDDVWEDMFGTGYTCSEDYYYKVVCPIKIYTEDMESHIIPNDVNATINGKKCDIQIADDGKSGLLSYIFEAKVLKYISNIDVTIEEPILGKTPNCSFESTVSPKGSLRPYTEACWCKLPSDLNLDPNNESWKNMEDNEVFTEGYYYGFIMYFKAEDGFSFNENTSYTANGKEIVSPYIYTSQDLAEIFISFGPLEPQYTMSIPFTTTVKQGGNVAPGKTNFALELVDWQGEKISTDNVKLNAVVNTNGKGNYKGTMTITGTLDEIMAMFDGDLFVKQVDEGKENWTYDDTVWGLILDEIAAFAFDDDMAGGLKVHIFPAIYEETPNGSFYQIEDEAYEVDRMSFTNTYTKSVSVTTKPTDPTRGNSNTSTKKNVETGDSSNLALWFALLAVSTVGVIGTSVYNKRKRNTESK